MAQAAGSPDGVSGPGRRRGRPFDHSRDAQILGFTLEALAEADYERLTLHVVAARCDRAKTTLYRRWPTKEALVVAAVHAAGPPPEADRLPDEGTLREDLLALVDSPWLGGPDRRPAVLAGLSAAARSSVAVADAVRTTVTLPHVQLYRDLLERAVQGHQVGQGHARQIAALAGVIPALSVQHPGVDGGREHLRAVVDDVVLPALSL